jgi:hypothetical protein
MVMQPAAYAQDKGKIIEYNLGAVAAGTVIKKTYEIDAEIINAVSMCECFKVEVKKKDKISLIMIEFDTSDYNGLTAQEVKLLDQSDNLITLKLVVDVEENAKTTNRATSNKF